MLTAAVVLVALWACSALIFSGVTVVATAILSRRLARARQPASWPEVVLLRPCEGAELGLKQNLASSLCRYPGRRRVIFLVPSESDASFAVAAQVVAEAPPGSVELMVTRVRSRRNRKCAHLAFALDRLVAPAVEGRPPSPVAPVIVHADSDIRLDDESLTALVGPLWAEPQVAASFAVPIEREGSTLADFAASGLLSASHQDFTALAALAQGFGGVMSLAGALAAHRTDELLETGGFESLEPLLGEDLEVGRRLFERRRKVAVSARPAISASDGGRSMAEILARTSRWTMVVRRQRPNVMATYPLLLACTPLLMLLSSLLWLVAGSTLPLCLTALLVAERTLLAWLLRRAHGLPVSPLRALALLLAGEILMLASFPRALVDDTVVWRGRRLRIRAGGVIEPADPTPAPDPREEAA